MKVKGSSISSFLLLLIWVCTVIFKLQTNSTKYWGIFWLLFLCISMILSRTVKKNVTNSKVTVKLIFSLIIWSLISTFLNWILGTSSNYKYSELLVDNFIQLVLPLICLTQIGKKASGIKFLNWFKLLMIIMSLWGLVDYVTRSQLYAPLIKTEQALYNMNTFFNAAKSSYRLTLVFYHPIYYALLLTICVIILLYFPFKNRAIQYISLCLVGLNIVLTQTRSAWICVIICILLFTYNNKWRNRSSHKPISKKRFQYGLITCAILVLVIAATMKISPSFYSEMAALISERINSLFLGNGTDIRLANFYTAYNMILSAPYLLITGGGLMHASSYLQNHPTLGYWTRAIDNQYLTNVLNYGLIGLSIYLVLFTKFVKGFNKDYNTLSNCLNLCLISIMIFSFVFEPIGSNLVFYLFVILISLSTIEGT